MHVFSTVLPPKSSSQKVDLSDGASLWRHRIAFPELACLLVVVKVRCSQRHRRHHGHDRALADTTRPGKEANGDLDGWRVLGHAAVPLPALQRTASGTVAITE